MIVNYFGEGCFRLQSGNLSVLVNSNNNRLKADVNLRTLTSAVFTTPSADEITLPGEYEVKEIEIRGWELTGESTDKFVKTVFVVNWEDMRFAFLGHLSGPLPGEVIEAMDGVDVLFIPTGDPHFVQPEEAARLVKQLGPAIVIPGYLKSPADLLKAIGQKGETMEKFVFKKKEIADKKSQVVVLEPTGGK